MGSYIAAQRDLQRANKMAAIISRYKAGVGTNIKTLAQDAVTTSHVRYYQT